MLTFVAFIFVFGLIIFAHELGHYLAARMVGVKVEEFAFGFPPRVWSKKIKDTVYAVNALPIGGYVKLYGEEGEEGEEKAGSDNLKNKKPWQKAVIFGAGVFMNFILAWLILTAFYAIGGQALIFGMDKHTGVENTQKVYIVDVVKDSPAAKQGLQVGDRIVSVEGKEVTMDEDVFLAIQEAKSKKDENINLVTERNGQRTDKTLATYKDKIQSGNQTVEVERIGIAMETKGKIQAAWFRAPLVAFQEMVRIAKMTAVGLVDFFGTIFTKFKLSEEVGGPIAIVQLSGAAAKLGFSALIQFVAVISITLGLINIIPFPALDGGHIFFLMIEKIRGKEIKREVKETINKIGFVLLLILIAAVTLKDLGRIGLFNFLRK